jgi:AcrR family transcriptional regulator
MPAKKTDRRVQRSRDLLLEAFRVLLMQRSYGRITIQNLLDQANVGRATFYAHFQSKDELLGTSIDGLREWLVAQWKATAPAPAHWLGFSLPLLRHLDSHRPIYHLSVGRSNDPTMERYIRKMLEALVREDLLVNTRKPTSASTLDLPVQHCVGALWAMIVWWMSCEAPVAAEEVERQFQQLSLPGIVSMFGKADAGNQHPVASS